MAYKLWPNMPAVEICGLRSIEADALKVRVCRKERGEVIWDGGALIDVGVQARLTGAVLKDIPERDAARAELVKPRFVRE
jgi:hypothetical protein